ncbi:Lyase catalytic [Pseudopedobacter saltans DSM 12145]|uniref:Lyase catalytic n=1 Tax=Pseudopedobacter saltans (strain ATCC 51119 / DSM 12145 / JCM 21818 / CCUG 39354 / LMG 10337 / NBRC 100064 / NCIMB 13643) TaxID=762903 RepID=F0S761_PSESL|nr:chondroitinase family polysaccharide lyase [Pseudopedobacter saltans]ADY54334.1 Lyase catalytic [Pseudopedobacter saltans DSM 12145]
MIKSLRFLILAFILFSSPVFAQLQVDICENTVPKDWKANYGKLSLSTVHAKMGKQSVKWDWTDQNASIGIIDKDFAKVADDPRSTFVLWLYNEKPIADQLHFVFYEGTKATYKFDVNLAFTGWRTVWVMYHRDMIKLADGGVDKLEITAPASIKKGTLYFDQVLNYVNINPRSPMRDLQVPFVNLEGDKAANAHWNSLYQFNANPGYLPLEASVSEKQKKQFTQITNRYIKLIEGKKTVNEQKSLDSIKKEFAFWDIKRDKGNISGRVIYSVNDIELSGNEVLAKAKVANEKSNVKRYAQLMLAVARLHHQTKSQLIQSETAKMYLDLLDHMEDQGWSYGSGMGALHHLGYNLADYYNSCLLMKDVIKQSGKLDRTFKTMYWYSGLGRTLAEIDQLPVSNIDVFNTLLGSMLSSALILDDTPEKHRYLKHFSNWMSYNVKPNTEITGAFKPDGAVFHHGTLYPAYGVGGYTGLAPIIYVLSKTEFQIAADAHQSFKENMMMMHYYTNSTRWPISVSGRHPTGTWRIPDMPYAYMALSGSPDGKETIDKDMAAVYLLVTKSQQNAYAKRFLNAGIKPAIYPAMHWTLNFGLLDIHRRNDWLLTIKAHNRYIVSHESYPNANVFGRYFSYGQLEVLYPESQKDIASNFKDKGWDWNRIPGTTTLHVPLDLLRADIKNVDDYSGVEEMLLTDEPFAGGVHLNKQGVFAMKLKGHDKYKMGSFKATKSWFTFDSLVVALGSDISNHTKEYPTETTLFQNYLNDKSDVISINNKNIAGFPYTQNKSVTTVLDNRKIGYYIPAKQNVVVYKKNQTSRDQKDLQDTKGDFAGLYINHGQAPQKQAYEYAMLVAIDQAKLDAFAAQMKTNKAPYTVLQKDSIMHRVRYNLKNITGMAIFASNKNLNDQYVVNNSKPCLVMYEEQKDKLALAVVDPDLAFSDKEDDTPRNPDGTRKEVSVYSRDWFKTPSRPTVVTLTLNGLWKKLDGDNKDYTVEYTKDGKTLLTINCKYGLTTNMSLGK